MLRTPSEFRQPIDCTRERKFHFRASFPSTGIKSFPYTQIKKSRHIVTTMNGSTSPGSFRAWRTISRLPKRTATRRCSICSALGVGDIGRCRDDRDNQISKRGRSCHEVSRRDRLSVLQIIHKTMTRGTFSAACCGSCCRSNSLNCRSIFMVSVQSALSGCNLVGIWCHWIV